MFGVEGSCEVHWTIAKISRTFAWFDLPNSVIIVQRHCMVYPTYRNHLFAKSCSEGTMDFSRGENIAFEVSAEVPPTDCKRPAQMAFDLNMAIGIFDSKCQIFTDSVTDYLTILSLCTVRSS
jgi:hypothetical protein